MLKECLKVFSNMLDEKTDALIFDSYIPADGTYIIIDKDGNRKALIDIKMDKKTRTIDGSHPMFPTIRRYDYYSQLISMNKPMDPKKVIHSNNYLSFFVKKDSISSGKLTNDIIDNYYNILLDPVGKKYKNSKEASRIYELYAEEYGTVETEKIEAKKDWIKKNIYSLEDINLDKKDYLKIFFEADDTIYEREGQRYFLPNIYNNNDYNIEIEEKVCGLPDNNLGMNAKKPFLAIKSRKYPAPYLLNNEEAILQKKFFDYLMNLVSVGLYNVYIDTENNEIRGYPNGKAPEKIDSGYYLLLKKGKTEAEIHAQDNIVGYAVTLKEPFGFLNVVDAKYKNQDYAEKHKTYYNRLEVGNLINEVTFSKWLNSNRLLDVSEIKISDSILKQNVIMSRDAIFDWIYKGSNQGLQHILRKTTMSLAKSAALNGYIERALWQLNLMYSFEMYYEKEGAKNMAEIISSIKTSIEEKVLANETSCLKSDEEYYYAIGQLAAYLISLNKSKDRKQSLINSFLNAKSNESIRLRLMQVYKKYNYNIQENSKRVKNILALIEGYKPEGTVNQEMILLGYATDNVIYKKEEK